MINKIKVENYKGVRNQFLLRFPEGTYLQSYDSLIVFKDINGNISLDEKYWNWSKTTSKYRSLFLNETTKETMTKINDKNYKLVNLNER